MRYKHNHEATGAASNVKFQDPAWFVYDYKGKPANAQSAMFAAIEDIGGAGTVQQNLIRPSAFPNTNLQELLLSYFHAGSHLNIQFNNRINCLTQVYLYNPSFAE